MEEGQKATEASRKMPFDDSTPMPFGKYGPEKARLKLGKTPPGYLLWLWDQGLHLEVKQDSDRGRLADYIKSSYNDLQRECDHRSTIGRDGRPVS